MLLPGRIRSHLDALLTYSWEAEISDWVEEGCPKEHVFMSLVAVDQWLHGHNRSARDLALEAGFEEERLEPR